MLSLVALACGEEATPTPEPIRLSGNGDAQGTIELSAGVWDVAMEVSNNENCLIGFCRESDFVVTVESDNGSRSQTVADKTIDDWTGASQVTVGPDVSELTPGQQTVTVKASGDWVLVFSR